MFKWFLNLFGRFRKAGTGKRQEPDEALSEIDLKIQSLDKKIESINSRTNLNTKKTTFSTVVIKPNNELKAPIFTKFSQKKTDSLSELKKTRLDLEDKKRRCIEEDITTSFNALDLAFETKDIEGITKLLNHIRNLLPILSNKDFESIYNQKHIDLVNLKADIQLAEQIIIAEKKRKQEQEEEELERRKKIEELNYRKLQKEEQIRKHNIFIKELRDKEQIESQKRETLKNLLLKKKDNSEDIIDLLQKNGIECFYHFTDIANIPQIKNKGGLFSWHYCLENNINIPKPGGDQLSQNLDARYQLEDYVRLSFCKDHPMAFIAKSQGRINKPVILEINTEVATLETTRFSNMNATKNDHEEGNTIDDLKKVHFDIFTSQYFNLSEDERHFYQAEVMIKTWIPIKYIRNIHDIRC